MRTRDKVKDKKLMDCIMSSECWGLKLRQEEK